MSNTKNNQYEYEQIVFVNEIMEIIGFKGLGDLKKEINYLDISQEKINAINQKMNKFKKIFNTKSFNLSRKKFILDTPVLTIAFIKKLLDYIGMIHITVRKNGQSFMRLKSFNKMLMYYIEQFNMSDIEQPYISYIEHEVKCINNNEYPNLISKHVLETTTDKNNIDSSRVKLVYKQYVDINAYSLKNLVLDFALHVPIKKIKLLNLPNEYTYEFYCNGVKVCSSIRENDIQIFDLSIIGKYEMLDIYKRLCNGKMNKIMTKEQNNSYLNFARIDRAYINVEQNMPYNIYDSIKGIFTKDVYKLEVEGLYMNNDKLEEFSEIIEIRPRMIYKMPIRGFIESIKINGQNNVKLITHMFSLETDNGEFNFYKDKNKDKYKYNSTKSQGNIHYDIFKPINVLSHETNLLEDFFSIKKFDENIFNIFNIYMQFDEPLKNTLELEITEYNIEMHDKTTNMACYRYCK